MKQPRGTSSTEVITLTDFKNLLRGSARPIAALRANLPRLLPVDYAAAAQWLSITPFRSKLLRLAILPSSYKDAFLDGPPLSLDLNQWAAWTAALAIANQKIIQTHLGLYDQLSTAFLEEHYAHAIGLLANEEAACGHSIWALQLRIALIQLTQGFDAQKQFTRTTREQAGEGTAVGYIAHYTSFRNESAISALYFQEEYLRHLSAGKWSKDLRVCVRYHLLNEVPAKPKEIVDLFSVETRLSLVDQFEAFLAVAAIASANHDSVLTAVLRSPLQQLADAIPHPRLQSITFAATANPRLLASLVRVNLEPFDSFVRGDYADAAKMSLDYAKDERGTHIDYDELAGCALAAGSNQPTEPLGRLPKALVSTISKDDQGRDEFAALGKIESNTPFPWALRAMQTAKQEIADTPFCDAFFLHNSCRTPPTTLNPYHAYTFTAEAAIEYLNSCRDAYGDSLSVRYVLSQIKDADPPTGIASDIALLARSDSALRRRNWPQALEAAANLETAGNPYFRQKAIRIRATSLLRSENIEECIYYITSVFIATPHLTVILPIADVVTATTEEIRVSIADRLSVPVLYDMYSRFVDKQQESTRRFAYEDFLVRHGVSRPSELIWRDDRFPRDLFVYFLRYICVPEIMDVSPVFETSKDVEDERIAVCNILADLDPAHKDVYQAENRDFLIRHSIQKGIRQVEQSKIFVDDRGVRQAVLSKYRETYNRLKAFGPYGEQELAEVERALTKANSGDTNEFFSLQVEKNEKNDILTALLVGIRDEYVLGPNYGLDGYLSVRIRHGTFGAQFRSPLEAAHLATQRDRDTGIYKSNDYWPARILTTNEEIHTSIGQVLANLSMRFDELTANLVRNRIQIARDASSPGYFNFTLNAVHLRLAAALIGDRDTLEEFVDDILGILRNMLRNNLENIRAHLLGDVMGEIDNILMSTHNACATHADGDEMRDLLAVLQATRAEMRRVTTKMADWFKLPSTTSTVPFSMDSAINIGVELVRSMYRRGDFLPQIEVADQTLYKGILLPAFVDLFMIMFENIIKHAGTGLAPRTHVAVTRFGEELQIAVQNDVSPGVRTTRTVEKLESIRRAIESGLYMRSVGKEEGTGLFKLQKIIMHDLAGSAILAFNFDGQNRFCVTIEMPFKDMAE